jgi:hypothetical protein
LQRCKTNIASNAKHPFSKIISVFRQTEIMLCFCDKKGG